MIAGIADWAAQRGLDFRHDPASGFGAVFSTCGSWRYLLWRVGKGRGGMLGIGMLNPSTADEHRDDPTIARCRSIALRTGKPGVLVWNLFALRATDPAVLKRAADPVGPDNDTAIALALTLAPKPLVAWGNHGVHLGRSAEVLARIADASAMGVTRQGQPKHPLYLRGDLMPVRLSRLGLKTLSSSSP